MSHVTHSEILKNNNLLKTSNNKVLNQANTNPTSTRGGLSRPLL